MSLSFSSLVDKVFTELHKHCKDCNYCLEYIKIKDNQRLFSCLKCNKNHKSHFSKSLTKRFANTYEFCNGGINKFILLLGKGIYP